MSDKIAIFDDLKSLLLKELSTAPIDSVLVRSITDAVREFFTEAKVWREWLAPIASVDYQQDYVLPNLFDASIHSISDIKVDSVSVPRENYTLHDEVFVRFENGKEPIGLSKKVLTCASTATDDIADWQAVTDAALVIDLDGSTAVTVGSFADADTFDDIARLIQTKIRQTILSSRVSVTWDGEAFTFSVSDGTIGYTSAPTSGTDLSLATWCGGRTGASTLGGRIDSEVVLRPDYSTTTVPDWLLDRWSLGIVHLAAFRLKTEPKKPWTDVSTAVVNRDTYQAQKILAIRTTIGGLNEARFSMSA